MPNDVLHLISHCRPVRVRHCVTGEHFRYAAACGIEPVTVCSASSTGGIGLPSGRGALRRAGWLARVFGPSTSHRPGLVSPGGRALLPGMSHESPRERRELGGVSEQDPGER